jgi:hypothetical protein
LQPVSLQALERFNFNKETVDFLFQSGLQKSLNSFWQTGKMQGARTNSANKAFVKA